MALGYAPDQDLRETVEHKNRVSEVSSRHRHAVHGQESRTYRTWQAMKTRCFNPKCHNYDQYGGRGITICDRWLVFENFLADMGARPPGTSIDRFPDVNGNYEPGNCRWATPKQQANNVRWHANQWGRSPAVT